MMGWVIAVISVAINVLLVWYAIVAARTHARISDDLRKLRDISEEFSSHLSMVYEMETFYGEPVLENLLKHAKGAAKEMREIWQEYTLEGGEQQEDAGYEDEDTDETAQA